MAKYRHVYTNFWSDIKVSEEMTPEDKYFFLYLLTNEHTKQIGVYQILKKQIAFEIGYSIESVNALMQRFIEHHKMIRYNTETREIAIKHWGKYNLVKGGKPMVDCVRKELEEVKDKELISYVGEYVKANDLKPLFDAYNVTSDDTSNDTSTIRGQKEKENQKQKENQNQNQNAGETECVNDSDSQPQPDLKNDDDAAINQNYMNNMIRNPIFAELISFYEQNISVVVPNAVRDAFNEFCDDYGHMDIKLVKRILQNTMMMPNVKHKINYAFKTLRALSTENVHTIEQHNLYERASAHYEQQPKPKGANQYAKRNESTSGQYTMPSIDEFSI